MPEIIDVLTLLPSKMQKFTVNTAVDYVATAFPAAPPLTLFNANGKGTFTNGDNFSILSAGIIFPEAFTPWKDPADLGILGLPVNNIFIKGASGDFYHIDVIGDVDNLFLPMENFELNMDIFVKCKNQENIAHPGTFLNENFFLVTDNTNTIKVSMKGIPAALNGKVLSIQPFFKILHNLPLI
jgi:hypothetical protein